jgi:lipopolysaccharide/colanic/teichoic acid biosynthesis glycosyltransferase/O-antigen/teichoic acid export membrane protein
VSISNRLLRSGQRPFVANIIALAGSMLALGVATLWVARVGGPVAVGDYALLRILPWLLAVIVSGGLAGSLGYFLSGPTRDNPHVRSTVIAIALVSSAAGAILWLIAAPLVHLVFFRQLPISLIAWVSVRVALRLIVITGKAAAQGSGDLPGSNLTILLEELMFLPAFGLIQASHVSGDTALIGALVLADLLTGVIAWARLLRRGFLMGANGPSLALARRMYAFGMRGQLGSLMQLLNLRFNFIFLGALAGPAALGIYAVASKYAEFLRLLPIAANWVLYPQFARSEAGLAAATSRRMILRAGAVTAAASIPLAVAASVVIPVLFGQVFGAAVLPARILLIGLAAEGVGGVVTAFLFGRGRPGLNSLAAGAGVVVTLVLDVILIPRYGAVGAAVASTVAYLTTTTTLVAWYRHVTRSVPPRELAKPVFDDLASVGPRRDVRVLDVTVAVLSLLLTWPLLLVVAMAARLSTGGSAIYRQVRVGQGGVPFTMYKFRSMRCGLDGPEITGPSDSRVTRFGAFMRATSLDELPQMINVLRGDMTLVGPRPETVALALRYPAASRSVFAHRPGLTGPVQITFRDAVPEGIDDVEGYYLTELIPLRTALDLAYANNATLVSTLALIAGTAWHVVSRVFLKLSSRSHRRVDPLLGLKERTT